MLNQNKMKNGNPCGDILSAIGLFLAMIVVHGCCTGCVSKGFKHIQGSEMIIGLSTPVSSASTVDISAMQMMSGQKLEVDKGNRVKLTARTDTEGSYFGVITTKSIYTVEAESVPTNTINTIESK